MAKAAISVESEVTISVRVGEIVATRKRHVGPAWTITTLGDSLGESFSGQATPEEILALADGMRAADAEYG